MVGALKEARQKEEYKDCQPGKRECQQQEEARHRRFYLVDAGDPLPFRKSVPAKIEVPNALAPILGQLDRRCPKRDPRFHGWRHP